MIGPKSLRGMAFVFVLFGFLALLPFDGLAQGLSIKPITWDVVGLSHNKPLTEGPTQFPVGVRVTNTSGVEQNNIVVTFHWNQFDFTDIFLMDLTPNQHIASLGPGMYRDVYYGVEVVRSTTNFDKGRRYYITAVSDESPTAVSTPLNRQLYIEKIQSQARNEIHSLTGPTEVFKGYENTFTLHAGTATGGYEQLTAWPLFPAQSFEKVEVFFTASAPPGFTSTFIYQDACGWDPNIDSPTYNSCVGPVLPGTSGKVGGKDITVTMKVIPTGAGNFTINSLIYDVSGASFHYNSDLDNPTPLTVLELRVYDPSTLGNLVFFDANQNGVFDPETDYGLPGVRVYLVDPGPDGIFGTADDIILDTQTTDAEGRYLFTPLKPGDYRVEVESDDITTNLTVTTGNFGFKDFVDLEEGVEDLSASFGYISSPLLVNLDSLAAVAPEPGGTVQIAWETASEFDNAGFNVYRAVSPVGRTEGGTASQVSSLGAYVRGERLNPFIIPAEGSEIQGAFYEFFDPEPLGDSDPATRSYYLEDIDMGGVSTLHGPVPVTVGLPFHRPATLSSVEDWLRF